MRLLVRKGRQEEDRLRRELAEAKMSLAAMRFAVIARKVDGDADVPPLH